MIKVDLRIFQIKVTLEDAPLPIWRSLAVDAATSLAVLHEALQIAMGWENCHLHHFAHGGLYYTRPDEEFDSERHRDDRAFQISHLLKETGDECEYMYDFGDDWRHTLRLQEVVSSKTFASVPVCTGGEGACPPEDVGGVYGYAECLEALSDESHSEHKSYRDWIGVGFDSVFFSLEETNRKMRGQFV